MSIFLSASSIADFIKCPRRVYYRFSKAIPDVPTREMILGKLIHKVLETGWKTREAALEILKYELEKIKATKQERTNTEFMVDMFFLNIRNRLTPDDLVELNFKLPLHDDVFLVGKIDRVSGGTVYDWKTSSKLSKNLSNDVQCIIYNYAFSALFKSEPSGVCLVSLPKGEIVPYIHNKSFSDELFNQIVPKMIKAVKAGNYDRAGIFNQGCFKCVYKHGCLGDTDVMDSTNFT